MIIVYFSLVGEQYSVGVVEEGNTSIIARIIAEQTGADLFKIEPTEPYPQTYSGLLDISRQEISDNVCPAYVGDVKNWDEYNIVFIGYPKKHQSQWLMIYCVASETGVNKKYSWNGDEKAD